MLLYYIRHGDPIYNPDSLTPLGQRQAEAVGRRLAIHGLDAIYSSTSNRAYQTALPASEILKLPITKLDWCNESHAWKALSLENPDTGKRTWIQSIPQFVRLFVSEEVRALGARWYEHPALRDYGFGEYIEATDREVDAFLASLGYAHDREKHLYTPVAPNEKKIALFAHAGFSGAFLSSLLDIPYPEFVPHFNLITTGMTVIRFTGHEHSFVPRIEQYGGDGHLYHDSLPTGF